MSRLLIIATILVFSTGALAQAESAPSKSEQAPQSEWKGIPLPPGAKPYKEAANGLVLLASAAPPFDSVEKWYMETLVRDGWKGTVTLRSSKPLLGDRFVSIDFEKDAKIMTIALTNVPKEGVVLLQLAWKQR